MEESQGHMQQRGRARVERQRVWAGVAAKMAPPIECCETGWACHLISDLVIGVYMSPPWPHAKGRTRHRSGSSWSARYC